MKKQMASGGMSVYIRWQKWKKIQLTNQMQRETQVKMTHVKMIMSPANATACNR